MGDVNVHTATERDHVLHDAKNNELFNLPENYIPDEHMSRRNSDPTPPKKNGKALLEFCIGNKLRILNGRKLGDFFGSPTYFGVRNKKPTLLDYCLAHIDSMKKVVSFRVCEFTEMSDHCMISATFKTGNFTANVNNNINCDQYTLQPIPRKYLWEQNRVHIFQEHLNCNSMKNKIICFMSENSQGKSDYDKVQWETGAVSDIIISAADKAFRKAKIPSLKPRKYPRHFDRDCFTMLRELKKMSRLLSTSPGNFELRKNFYRKKKAFKKLIKMKEKQKVAALVDKLNSGDLANNPKDFWKIIDKLQQAKNGTKTDKNDVSAQLWVDHFKGLMVQDKNISPAHQEIIDFIQDKKNLSLFNNLNFKITESEVNRAIKNLKKGKTCGPDSITNEMIKASIPTLIGPITKMFNTVFSTCIYPCMWSKSWIKPLHKGGDSTDPNRYRGIAIMSCMGKLFCSVLNNRLVQFSKENKINKKEQIGFMEDCRTSDHIFTLKTITDNYVQKGKRVYCSFIDFKKAFDSVWRPGMFYKLIKQGIGGNFINTIQSMYSNCDTAIKLKNGLTEYFNANTGVKQGCVLSPTLFKLFVNDIPDIFDATCEPVTLFHYSVSALMFADDIVLVSETPSGLQSCLDKLDIYCKKWFLDINPEKSKIMIFNKSGRKIVSEKFLYRDSHLEIVNTYTYLGITFCPSGTFSHAISNLSKKASKAMYKIRNSIIKSDIRVKTALYLFDSLVRPICTYGCEVWGSFISSTEKMLNIQKDGYKFFDEQCYEKLDLKFMKSLLGVHSKASNIATRGELGRLPISLYIIKQIVNYWVRITEYDKSTLLYDAYLCNLNMLNAGKKCWLSNVYDIIYNKLGQQHMWNNQGSKMNRKYRLTAQKNLLYIFHFQWANALKRPPHSDTNSKKKEGNKLRTYNQFKSAFKFEPYLDHIAAFHDRRNICRFRTSAHHLQIERGRYTRPVTPIEKRLCKVCNEIEDEKHLLLKCKTFNIDRNIMFDNLFEIFPSMKQNKDEDNFNFIMSSSDPELSFHLSHFISNVNKKERKI